MGKPTEKQSKNNRDEQGRFAKGHDPTVYERKPGANSGGRPREPKRQVQDALAKAEEAMPDIFEGMIAVAKDNAHKDSQRAKEYLADRLLGKPRQALELEAEVNAALSLTPDQIAQAAETAEKEFDEGLEDADKRQSQGK